MIFHDCKNFAELLAQRRKDFPQVIAAGWITPAGQPVGAAAIAADKTPTEGELAAAWAACLAGCLMKIDELCEGKPAEMREQVLAVVEFMVGGLEVYKRLKSSGLVSPQALAGARA